MALDLFPVDRENRSIFAVAFHKAITDLAAKREVDERTKEIVVDAILSAGATQQTDPETLAQFAVKRCEGS